MRRLLHANFGRLAKNTGFYLCMAFMLAAGLFVAFKTSADFPLERTFFAYTLPLGLVSAVFSSLFLGTEYADGTIRNKLIVGHTKSKIYLAGLLVCIAAGFLFCLAFIVPMLAVGIPRLGFFEMKLTTVLALFGTSLALSAAFSGIFTLIGMLCQKKAIVAVLCILCFLALLCLSAAVQARLQEPPLCDNYVMSVDGVAGMQHVPNPNYLEGAKREAYQFLLDLLPTGQALQFTELSMVHTWQLPVYSLLLLLLSAAIGIPVFRKQDIR